MKIVMIMGQFSFGGAERVMCALASHFCKQHQVVLMTLSEGEKTYPLDDAVRCINGIGRTNDIDAVLKMRRIFKEEKPDIIISFIAHINVAALIAAAGLHIPVIVSERNDPARSATSVLRKVLRWLTYPLANGLVFQTEDAKCYFSKTIQRRGTIIPNPLFLTEEVLPWDDRQDEIVCVGRYVPQKRQDIIINAFAATQKNTPYTLTFYGEGEARGALQRQVAELGLDDRITVSDAVRDLHRRIKHAKLFVMMSEYEGMPNALMEALGLGLACISSDCPCGGPRFLIEDGVNGRLVPVGDQDALEAALRELTAAPDVMKTMAEKAVEVRQLLSAERVYGLWDGYIQRVLKRKEG